MKKKSLVVKIIAGIIITPIILFALLIGGIFGYAYYQEHFSTDAKLKKYIQTNDMEKLKKLKLDKGVDEYYPDGKRSLIYAIEQNNIEAVKYFIEQGANIHKENVPAVIRVVDHEGHVGHVHPLAPLSPLQLAEEIGNPKIIELLKSAGAK